MDGIGRLGVIDIGSNTVRLVVYDPPTRLPFPVFNEKADCMLGRGLAASGRLNPDGVIEAMRSLSRFTRLCEAMEVDRLEAVATAAVRDANDGPEFVDAIRRRFGLTVQVVDGAEESRYAALGVLSGTPEADGLLGDLGGGSLDLVSLDHGIFGSTATLPLGHLRVAEIGPATAVADVVGQQLSTLPWIDTLAGRAFHAVGGSWRAVARVILERTGWPLHVIDGFSVPCEEAMRQISWLMEASGRALRRIRDLSGRRVDTLPHAAAVMHELLRVGRPDRVVFSGFGMREGKMLSMLPDSIRVQDPLISGCTRHAERAGRFSVHGEEILTWMAPVFPDADAAETRLRMAACLLSDIAWSIHPDFSSQHGFLRALRLPFAGLTHEDRVFIAVAVHVRYGASATDLPVPGVVGLLSEDRVKRAQVTGLALRLAHMLSGGAPGLLPRTRLRRTKTTLVLKLPEEREVFEGDAVERRFRALARSLGLKAVFD